MALPKGKPRKPVNTDPENTEETKSEAVEIADMEEAELQVTQPESAASGKRFFFGEVGVLKFDDGTTYHIQKHHVTLTDQSVIANVMKEAEKPNSKIFVQD